MKTIVSILLVGFVWGNGSLARAQEIKNIPIPLVPAEGYYDETYQFLFFAVLEGCYIDGLAREDIDLIIPAKSMGNFVLSCPICEPAYDGFVLYSDRKIFSRQPGKRSPFSYNTFGQGLSEGVRAKLAKPGQSRRDAIQGLIGKWVDERIAKLRLNEEETKALRDQLAERRKKGEKALERFQNGENGDILFEKYKSWTKGCPICSGASPMGGE